MKILDVLNSPWAIVPDKWNEIADIYGRHLKGDKIDIGAIEAAAGQRFDNSPQGYEVINNVAIVPLQGVIAKRMNLFSRISGGASTELFKTDLLDAINDTSVNSVIISIDSPGGTVDGTASAADVVYSARGEKPIVVAADGLMASAAYWIGSAADRVYIVDSTTQVGSIGVISTHVDYSKMYDRAGVKVTEIYAGKYKRLASQYKPLTKEAQQSIQDKVDYLYSLFVEAVANHRDVSVQTVLDDMADGKIFVGQQAIDAGLVDGVSTQEQLIAQLSSGKLPDKKSSKAQLVGDTKEPMNDKVKNVIQTESIKGESEMDAKDITKGYLLENHADLVEEFRAEGKSTIDVGKITEEAATNERNRIQSVFNVSMPGHEKLINELAFDGKTTGPEAAVKIIDAEKQKKVVKLQDIKADSSDVSGVQSSINDDKTSSSKEPEGKEKWTKEWNSSTELQDEFISLDSYLSYREIEKKNKKSVK